MIKKKLREKPRKRPKTNKWNAQRQRIWNRDKGKCRKCDRSLTLEQCHIDHIIPVSKGGMNRDSNLRVLCRLCHALRADSSHAYLRLKGKAEGWLPSDWKRKLWSG